MTERLTDSSEFSPDMDDHDYNHGQRADMCEACRRLKDDRIRQ